MLLLLICTVGPVVGYYGAHYATLGFFHARAALKSQTLSPERTITQ